MYLYYYDVQNLQQLEERRVGKVQEYIQRCADIENDAVPIVNTCIAGIVSAAKTVNPTEVRSALLPAFAPAVFFTP